MCPEKNEHQEQERDQYDGSKFREEVFSKSVRAGKRTYFFDVKATRKNEYYLTITESKKKTDNQGRSFYEKHKIFLYKEDFEKFSDGLSEVIDFITENQPEYTSEFNKDKVDAEYSNVDFDDLSR
jgi:hypothetical protein